MDFAMLASGLFGLLLLHVAYGANDVQALYRPRGQWYEGDYGSVFSDSEMEGYSLWV